jgi:hypothetical protein
VLAQLYFVMLSISVDEGTPSYSWRGSPLEALREAWLSHNGSQVDVRLVFSTTALDGLPDGGLSMRGLIGEMQGAGVEVTFRL